MGPEGENGYEKPFDFQQAFAHHFGYQTIPEAITAEREREIGEQIYTENQIILALKDRNEIIRSSTSVNRFGTLADITKNSEEIATRSRAIEPVTQILFEGNLKHLGRQLERFGWMHEEYGIPFDDLFNTGAEALIAAIRRFDPGHKPTTLSQFTHMELRDGIFHLFADQAGVVAVPLPVVYDWQAIRTDTDGHEERVESTFLRDYADRLWEELSSGIKKHIGRALVPSESHALQERISARVAPLLTEVRHRNHPDAAQFIMRSSYLMKFAGRPRRISTMVELFDRDSNPLRQIHEGHNAIASDDTVWTGSYDASQSDRTERRQILEQYLPELTLNEEAAVRLMTGMGGRGWNGDAIIKEARTVKQRFDKDGARIVRDMEPGNIDRIVGELDTLVRTRLREGTTLPKLNALQLYILVRGKALYEIELNDREIADIMGVTRTRAEQLYTKAFRKLRNPRTHPDLYQYERIHHAPRTERELRDGVVGYSK